MHENELERHAEILHRFQVCLVWRNIVLISVDAVIKEINK